MTNCQNILECVFHAMGKFAFSRAKEICDKEKDAIKNPTGFALGWSHFMGSMAQLSQAENAYFALTFLLQTPNNPKAFRKKEVPLQAQYGQIKQDLDKQMDNLQKCLPEPFMPSEHSSGRAGHNVIAIPAAVLVHLGAQLSHFTTARLDMIEIYEQIHEMGLNKSSSYDQLAVKIDLVVETYGKKFHHPLLTALETSFSYETEVLKNLIEAQLRMLDCSFMASLIRLNHALRFLTLWPNTTQCTEPLLLHGNKPVIQKAVPPPALLTWFCRYHTALLAKFSLYFHDVLSKQTSQAEIRNLLAKTSPDYYQKIAAFHRKTDAYSVCLVLDTNGMEYHGMGYRKTNQPTEALAGIDSYPAMFSFPPDRPTKHWPSVVMTLTLDADKLVQPDVVVAVNDKGMDRTYFLGLVEPRIYLVVIYESRKSDKDTAINQFLLDMISQLRCSKTLESLKPA